MHDNVGGSRWAEFQPPASSILFDEGGPCVPPSPLPPGTTLGHDRPPRSGGNAEAHIAGQEFAIRVCSVLPGFSFRRSLEQLMRLGCQPRNFGGHEISTSIAEGTSTISLRDNHGLGPPKRISKTREFSSDRTTRRDA
ncbi:hypothetical protein KM043_004319 [Ampulex compressa]|nr:hypothetical protein KM043_004319 [Ampulex compressa]